MPKEDVERYWNHVPWSIVPPSFQVDLCLFLAGVKPAIRTHVKHQRKIQPFLNNILDFGWHPVHDKSGFLVISKDKDLSQTIIQVDQSPPPHAIQLGCLLGYPECCSKFIEHIGEDGIDKVAEGYKRTDFKGLFSFIDISSYLEGIALISHVPCSTECQPSLNIALSVYSFVKENSAVKGYNVWASSVIDYFRK